MSETPTKTPLPRPHGPRGHMAPGEKAKDFKGTMRKLIKFMGRFKGAQSSP